MSWRRCFTSVLTVFKRRPFVANVATYGLFYVSAELTQQWMDGRFLKGERTKSRGVDWDSLARYGLIGTAGIAPFLFVWYRFLDKRIVSRALRHVAAKVVIDQSAGSSTCLVIFFVGMSALEGKEDIFEELKKKFWSTYMVSCCFWPTVQAVNFGLLPPHTRVAFVGAASFVWANFLCLVKRRQSVATPSDEEHNQTAKEE